MEYDENQHLFQSKMLMTKLSWNEMTEKILAARIRLH